MSNNRTSHLRSFPDSMTVLVQGASRGIGLGLVQILAGHPRVGHVIATCREPNSASSLLELQSDIVRVHQLDVSRAGSVNALAGQLCQQQVSIHLLINAAGLLHGPDLMPEKKLEDLNLPSLQQVFAVNTFGPALIFKAFQALMASDGKAVLCAISARVGSISDNRLGGWYAYRASKAALNQLVKTASIELRRRKPNLIVAALHPGTTSTGLSQPFQARVPAQKLFSVEQTSRYLLNVIDGLGTEDSGDFFAWDGARIEW
ncbi:MAG: SDR family NAD(P)-dependent oxidoreductase [Pseudomonadota bacterium]